MNYDGQFSPRQGSTSTSASRPASPDLARKGTPSNSRPTSVKSPRTSLDTPLPDIDGDGGKKTTFEPWKIYPPPPKPHWEHRDPFTAKASVDGDAAHNGQPEFNIKDCEIPGEHPFAYEIDSMGVYQVYKTEDTRKQCNPYSFVVNLY